MNVMTLLNEAAECKTQNDADNLLDMLERAFAAGSVSHLERCNSESCMEDGKPFVRFELNRIINENYITMIRPEIRDGKLVVVVTTNRMLDGLGMGSRSWKPVEGMEEHVIEGNESTVQDMARQAKGIAISHHAELIESVGVPHSVALDIAEKSW